MNKVTSIVLASAICVSLSFGADFSKKSNDELIKIAGTVAPKDVPDYRIELHKRFKTMKKEDAKVFHQELETSMKQNTATMSVKDFRARKQAIQKAIDEKLKGMSKEQIKESGLVHKHMMYKTIHHPEKKPHHKPSPKPDPKNAPKPTPPQSK
ncbi:DUF1104 domain-containing protein [Helicobacter sp. 11S03491-1]|uniref:DUF1104 domain-containing protein n=1 Tax=Helicobacter sp. 11S03491-1 TaxID=1476196 RepID=UPI000BA6217D|nr:DUF1104 domain-containing protein [Helicobacter sp. 11S03491-1]PAF42927.1 hypothetical protein BKH45_02340 [Helicobacter sp. 11S03491-1]